MPDPDAQAFLAAATDRYGAIETAYRQEGWRQVISQGRQLLDDLGGADEPLAMALRLRVQLLMAHSYLHGEGDRDAAEDLYRLVLSVSGAEAALRRSAEEGLRHCNQPMVRPAAQAQEPDPEPARPAEAAAEPAERPQPEPVAPPLSAAPESGAVETPGSSGSWTATAAATPWLATSPTTATPTTVNPIGAAPIGAPPASLIPEVVEEPELLEVRRADPEHSEEIQLEPDRTAPDAATAAQLLAASATAEAMAEVVAARSGLLPSTEGAAPEDLPQTAGADAIESLTEVAAASPLEITAEAAEPPSDFEEFDAFDEMDDPELLEGLLLVTLG